MGNDIDLKNAECKCNMKKFNMNVYLDENVRIYCKVHAANTG